MKNVLYEHCEEYIKGFKTGKYNNYKMYQSCWNYITNIIPYDAKETKDLLRFFSLKEVTNNYS
jgi:hypothetical protein